MTTASKDKLDAIRLRFDTEVAQAVPIPTQYDNQEYEPSSPTISWIRFTILPGLSQQVENRLFRYPGIAIAQVFTPVEAGDGYARTVADLIQTAFRAVNADGVVYRTPYETTVGRTDEWWQLNVTIPYFYDDDK